MTHLDVLKAAGLDNAELTSRTLLVRSPIDGATVAHVAETPASAMPEIIADAQSAFKAWRTVSAPRRGELIRLLGEELRAAKDELGAVATLEAGKIVPKAWVKCRK